MGTIRVCPAYRLVATEPISLLLLFLCEEDFDLSLFIALLDGLQCAQEAVYRIVYEFLRIFILYCRECDIQTIYTGWLDDPKETMEEYAMEHGSECLSCCLTVDYLNMDKNIRLILGLNGRRTKSKVSAMKGGWK